MFKNENGKIADFLVLKSGETMPAGKKRLAKYGWEIPTDVVKIERLIFTSDVDTEKAQSLLKEWVKGRENDTSLPVQVE